MDNMSWLKQDSQPLFPAIEWAAPQNTAQAGKLVIVGGHQARFHTIAMAHQAALTAGAGQVRSVLPQSLKRRLPESSLPLAFVPDTPSGSLSQEAITQLQAFARWGDAVLWPGELGGNSATAILLERWLDASEDLNILAGDAIDRLPTYSLTTWNRPSVVLITTLPQLQQLGRQVAQIMPLKHDFGVREVVNWLEELGNLNQAAVVVILDHQLVVAYQGQISSTKITNMPSLPNICALMSVRAMQHPSERFAALTTAAYEAARH